MRKAIVLGALLAVAPCLPSQAQDAGPDRNVLLYDSGAARSLAMGGAFTAVADDLEAVLWNPAGIALMPHRQFGYGDSVRTDPKSLRFGGYAAPAQEGPSAGITYLRAHNKAYGITETSYTYTFAQPMSDRLAVGGNVKYTHFKHINESKQGFGGDVGALYAVSDALRFGAAVLNVTNPRALNGGLISSGETVPATRSARVLNVGASYRINPYTQPGKLGTAPLGFQTTLAFDVFDATDQVRRQMRFGVEHQLGQRLLLRAGLMSSTPTAGLGLRMGNYMLNAGVLFGRNGERSTESMVSLTASY